MTFSFYEEASKRIGGGCRGIQDEKGRKFPCKFCEQYQIEELVEILNRSDISEIHIKDVIRDFEYNCFYQHLGIC